jgi:GAF domain-containing protein
VAELQASLQKLQHDHDSPEAEELLDVLETAYEELRVADEEVRAQQEHIAHLVEGQQLMRWQHERMLAILPVPVLTTDQYGTVRSVNAAGSWLAERRVARMVGKPIFALFATEDRNSLRAALARQSHDKVTFRIDTAVVRPGSTDEAKVEAIASVSGAAQVDWMLLSPATGLPDAGPSGLPEALVELAALPFVVDGLQDVLNRGAEIAQSALGPGVTVSVNIGDPRGPTAMASTSPSAQAMDGAQVVAGEGPCVDSFDLKATVRTSDVRSDPRWTGLARHVPLELRGAVSAPLEVGNELVGTLNVYEVAPMERELSEAAELLAVTVAAVMRELQVKTELESLADDLRAALTSRATIDQAKGVIMAQLRCGPDEAFAHLVHLSSTTHVKLRELALELVENVQSTSSSG